MITSNIVLILSDVRGVKIPHDFVTGFHLDAWSGIKESDAQICQDITHEGYWDAWDSIMSSARYVTPEGKIYSLHQDGDLFCVAWDDLTDEEYHDFVGEPRS